jgi:peptidylprolyl isomerase
MKKILLLLFLIGTFRLFAAPVDTLTMASGLKLIRTVSVPNGIQPQNGDLVKVHYTGTLTTGKVFDSSRERGQPYEFPLGKGQVIPGWDEGIALLRKGEKATLVIPAHLGYGDRPTGSIPPNSVLIFDVELVDITATEHPTPYVDSTMKVTKKKTLSGLEYIQIKTNKKGIKADSGLMVEVHYTGYLTNGKIFDSSIERGKPFPFKLALDPLIPGWVEGVRMMRVGEKYRFIIPPQLAYGDKGAGNVIAPNSTLIFDVELIAVHSKPVPFVDSKKKTTPLKTASGLQYIIVKKNPKGIKADSGKTVEVHYTGYLPAKCPQGCYTPCVHQATYQTSTDIFDSSVERGETFKFKLGVDGLIKGWVEGMYLMRTGEKFRLIIPSELAYGDRGAGSTIPPNATLTFDIELISVK